MSKRPVIDAPTLRDVGSLSCHELFKDLPASRLCALEKNSLVREFPARHTFFHPGETGDVVFLLERGRVETFRTSGREKKLILAELTPPAVFGEMACLGACVYHCSAQTTEASRIRTVPKSDFEAVLREYPIVTRQLLELVSRRFVHVLLDLDAMSFRHLIPRLANLLLERAEDDCIRNMTHKEIAENLRVYRESATAALGELRKAGIISVARKQIRIIDWTRLERATRE